MEEINASVQETLKEIAALLRQQAEDWKQMAAKVEDLTERKAPWETRLDLLGEESSKRMEEFRSRAEKRQTEIDAKRQQIEDEEHEFRQNLLMEIRRHNDLLDRIASRL